MIHMIQSTISGLRRYLPIQQRLTQAVPALEMISSQPFEPGRHAVDGDNIFINAVEYETKPVESAVMEAHRAYIDVMLMLEGEERIACCDLSAAGKIIQPYDAASDACLAELPDRVSFAFMRPGDVVVFFPEDGHAPGLDTDARHKVRKLIAKVKV